uniref:Uncharacterized protein n=1 Tax=viral metagenome TaxID=1070528 RepID=A0A6C0BTS4_9ZZZZ
MNDLLKTLFSILLGYLFVKILLKSCNDFHTIDINN